MEVGQLSIEHLCSESKKIKKMKTKLDLIIASPKNSSEIVPHFKPVESNDFFLGRYILIDHLADGTFGRVFKAIDRYSFTPYAIKIVKPTKNCVENAKTEATKLMEIYTNVSFRDKCFFVKLIEHFEWRENYCLVFEKLSLNLYECLKLFNNKGYPSIIFKQVLKQILQAINSLHSLDLIHSDLKPENVLFINDPSKPNNMDFSIKIIDFGNVAHVSEGSRSIITTRQYRAPEVILGCCKWGKPSDVWSIGCVALEIYTGDIFFNTNCNKEHIGLIEKALGNFPVWMVKKAKNPIKIMFHYREIGTSEKLCVNKKKIKRKMVQAFKERTSLKETCEERGDKLLYDLLKRIMNIDPLKRLTCEEALNHQYFK